MDAKVYAWIDLETTGLDLVFDDVLEAAMVVTTPDLRVLDQPFTTVVTPAIVEWHDRIRANPIVNEMHTTNGLIEAIYKGQGIPLWQVQMQFCRILSKYAEPGEVRLAGSGVGVFDLPIIRETMPLLAGWFDYAVMDVGVLRRFIREVLGRPDLLLDDPKAHRALPDLQFYLKEMEAYQAMLRNVVGAAPVKLDSQPGEEPLGAGVSSEFAVKQP